MKKKETGKKNRDFVFILLVFIVFFIHSIIFLYSSKQVPAWDESWHAMISLSMYREINNNGYIAESIERFPVLGFAYNYYPHFFHYTAFPFYFFFGTGYNSALMSNLLFLFVLLFSSYFIGKKLFNPFLGMILSIIVSSIPTYLTVMKLYLIDYALFSLICLSYMFLLYSENFKDRKFTVLFWISLGFGTLTKWTFILYIIVPLAMSLIQFTKLKNRNFFVLIISFLVFLLIICTWYTPAKVKTLVPQLLGNVAMGQLEKDPFGMNFANFTYYIKKSFFDFSIPYIFLFGLSVFGKRKNSAVLYNILFIFLFFTFIQNKDSRYFSPAYLFMSVSILELYNKNNKKFMLLLILFAAAFNIYSQPSYDEVSSIPLVLDKIQEEAWVCVISETRSINDVSTAYFALLDNPNIKYLIGNGCNPLNFNYVIVGPIDKTWREKPFLISRSVLENNIEKYSVIYSEGEVSLLKKK